MKTVCLYVKGKAVIFNSIMDNGNECDTSSGKCAIDFSGILRTGRISFVYRLINVIKFAKCKQRYSEDEIAETVFVFKIPEAKIVRINTSARLKLCFLMLQTAPKM